MHVKVREADLLQIHVHLCCNSLVLKRYGCIALLPFMWLVIIYESFPSLAGQTLSSLFPRGKGGMRELGLRDDMYMYNVGSPCLGLLVVHVGSEPCELSNTL